MGFRYHDGKLVNTGCLPGTDVGKTYIFEGLLGKYKLTSSKLGFLSRELDQSHAYFWDFPGFKSFVLSCT